MNLTVIQSLHIRIYIVVQMYIKGHVETVNTKDQNNAIVYAMLFVNTVNMNIKACNALNAILIDTLDTGVCGFYTTLYTE